ncbi:hypothetical protein J463_2438 [Acinetobacter baumannii 1043794]|nr:hypothetical protein J527_1416 [Acinetobacter baumannii 1267820]EXC69487.1 hypothetical protein J463_2438 [Acinetobacter baumannii 1043794]EXD93326.1 hypothetical protein J462_0150 [Acinetobacter baumannii 972082]EXE95234.1 hypothetical protein J593_1667 [Acinetobacter baumannii 232184]EXF07777.1 hypothetical protein J600_2410 [Acinetobacter baumannii 268680]EXH00188.1 hypothetical protein J649_1942 [Acinetobacter baumannii 1064293_45]EYT19133.1 hypothetical protein J592_01878 [Acinetobact
MPLILNMRKAHICMNIYRLITAFFTHNIELNKEDQIKQRMR